ncbi:hypothetical protein PLA107_008410 [Pseudomonas amygdali pv. lachrymans str. M301315]|uniref:Uncharacterized protein n=1 Tax=Pseudomonas amygdali pv. lachrymans str. M301315 TaxID=629260 RepID=A0AAD0LWL2_PSEAV|nr:hypothetical protein PLA107_008410 [Pseudomonas amygdali pv. lachrymans str. M301315]PWC99850.1 hypothetical protein CX658_26880 [Pseudomonas amygdali pv. lachrymans]
MGANLFAKKVVQPMRFWGMRWPFREQVRSHGLQPESKADLYSSERGSVGTRARQSKHRPQ